MEFMISNSLNASKIQNKIATKNAMKFSLLMKYFQTNFDIKVQTQIFDNITEIKEGLIKIEEKEILIKNIISSESLYQRELLKLMDRSIAENIIVYLIEKFPKTLKK